MRHLKGLSSKSSLPEINLKAMLTATSDFYHFLIFDRPLWIGKIYLQYYLIKLAILHGFPSN